LGLPIARGFARAHGGDLTCEPPPPGETGAVFRLLLPVRVDPTASTERLHTNWMSELSTLPGWGGRGPTLSEPDTPTARLPLVDDGVPHADRLQ
ncbi:MAG TPA: hypothetical protein VGD84_14780, partial [Pseudonocardiaceae bacterium]